MGFVTRTNSLTDIFKDPFITMSDRPRVAPTPDDATTFHFVLSPAISYDNALNVRDLQDLRFNPPWAHLYEHSVLLLAAISGQREGVVRMPGIGTVRVLEDGAYYFSLYA
jgi:hypothetical protein